MTKQVTLTIDGVQVTVPAGTLIVDAAKKVGIDIPVFCYHPKMEPAGMCRMCLVEIGRPMIDRSTGQPMLDENGQPQMQFMPKPEAACTNVVSDGMVVLTQSEKAKEAQKGILEFLLTSHPLDCPICDKGGECPLQNLTMEHGPGKSRFLYGDKMHMDKHVPLGELIYLDRERCILCGRCVRFQDEVVGEAVLAIDERGRGSEIISVSEPGFDSVFSGNTTDICPVGALTTADFRFGARPWELLAAASVCAQCPVGCNITFNTRREAKADGKVVIKRVMPRQNEQVNEVWICDKGRFAYHYAESKARLEKPLLRKDDKLKIASWDSATKLVAEKLGEAGKDVVVLASGRLSNEDLFNLKSLADGLGGKAVLYTDMGGGDLVMQVGVGQGTNFADLGKGDAILVVASDLYEEAPIWWLRVKQAADRGATLIVANARETKLDKFAKFVIRYSNGDEIKTVQDLGGKSKIAEAFAKAENAIVLFGSDGLGLEGSSNLAAACANLLVKTGHTGKRNNGLIGVWPKANNQGAWEMGFRPEADLAKIIKGKTVYIAAADPAGDDPALEKAFKNADFVVVQDLFQTATAELADVVLPAQAYTERDGTFTSGERRVQRFYPAVPPLGETKADYAITAEIAKKLNIDLEGSSPVLVFERLAASVKDFAGLSYAKLAEVAEQWPIVGRGDLYYGGTTYENTQGLGVQLVSAAERGETVSIPKVREEAGLRPKEDELLAVPVTKLYDRGTTVSPAELLAERIGETFIALHPDAAKKLGVEAGKTVKVSFDGVKGEAIVRIDETISAGVALIPRSMGLAIREPVAIKVK
ncbi:MAG: NADH-quinone oxidoreductase subunit NuoG [Anaerolineales bacterium]|nr:NADH-quinone oxidoreductase subunit NuoG [Anaerolineales bacterium]